MRLWGGRFAGETDARAADFTRSTEVDRALALDDLDGSVAHVRGLGRAGLLEEVEVAALVDGLRALRAEVDAGTLAWDPGLEDVHLNLEAALAARIGPLAGKLHTGRSRNDQVATDLRLWARRTIDGLDAASVDMERALVDLAEREGDAILPGMTHIQPAQPVLFAHHLLAYVEMLQRDAERLGDGYRRCDVLPLGSGALAGTTLPIDRASTQRALGFAALSANSLDAVSDRDFAVELVSTCALLMVHLSRLAEEIVLWTTAEFGFAELPDTHATGSSLMPQKKNPDILELARGRVGRVTGDLVALLTVLKGLPLAYNRDLQEDKEPLFDAVDTSLATLGILADVVRRLRFDVDAMRRAASDPMLLATDVAEHLVARGMPFREAHALVGAAVRRCVAERRTLADMSVEEWRELSDRFDEDVVALFDVDAALRRRELPGGPGPRTVARALPRAATGVARTRKLAATFAR